MRIFNAIIAGLAGAAMLHGAAFAALTGYLKIPDIEGESQRAAGGEHEIEYDILAAKFAEGRKYGDITLKRGTMAPALERSFKTKTPIRSMTVVFDGAEYELTNVLVTGIRGGNVSLAFEKIDIKYTQQSDDHSGGGSSSEEISFGYNEIKN